MSAGTETLSQKTRSKNDEKLHNLCLEARPDLNDDELLIYSHGSRIQREGKPYYAEAVMRHTKDGSGFDIQIDQQKWILKHSANILRVHRVGTSLQLDINGKNPRHIVYVELGSHNFEVFSSSNLNDVAKARAFVEKVVGEINSFLRTRAKTLIASKELKRITYDCFAGPPATGMSYDNNAVFTSSNQAFSKAAAEKEVREYVPKILGGAGVCGNLYKEMIFESGTVMQIYPGCGKVVISCEGKPIERLSMAQVLMLDKEIACSTFSSTDKCALSRHLGLMCAKADLCQICLCHAPGTPGFGFESCLCADSADIERLAEHPKAIICCPCVKQAIQNYLCDSLLDEKASDDDVPPLESYTENDEPELTCTCERICYGCGGASEVSSSAASSREPGSYDLKVGPCEFRYYIDARILFAMGSSAYVNQIQEKHCTPSCSVYQDRLLFSINHARMSFETPSITGTEQLILAQKVGGWLLELHMRGVFK